jgi:hypothetical protein
MADESKEQAQETKGGPSRLMREAMEAYGIAPEFILDSKDYGNRVVIVTKAGFKAKFEKGDKVKKLKRVQLDPVPPEKAEAESED